MSRLALYLLGPPRLELDGEPIQIGHRKAMALLAYLAVTGQPHSRDSLATLLCRCSTEPWVRDGRQRFWLLRQAAIYYVRVTNQAPWGSKSALAVNIPLSQGMPTVKASA